MGKNRSVVLAAMVLVAIGLLATAGCKTSGMAVTTRGQLLKINIGHPDFMHNTQDNLDVTISNRGVNNAKDVLVEVELPPQFVVFNQTNDRGVNVIHEPGSNLYHFTMENVQPGENSLIRFRVGLSPSMISAAGSPETVPVKVTAWQRDLPGDKLVETAEIKLR